MSSSTIVQCSNSILLCLCVPFTKAPGKYANMLFDFTIHSGQVSLVCGTHVVLTCPEFMEHKTCAQHMQLFIQCLHAEVAAVFHIFPTLPYTDVAQWVLAHLLPTRTSTESYSALYIPTFGEEDVFNEGVQRKSCNKSCHHCKQTFMPQYRQQSMHCTRTCVVIAGDLSPVSLLALGSAGCPQHLHHAGHRTESTIDYHVTGCAH